MTPTLGSINLLEWLREFKETFYLLDYQFIIKSIKLRIQMNIQMEETHRARYMDHGASTPLSPNLHMFTNPQAL